jgi:hypothetical protein
MHFTKMCRSKYFTSIESFLYCTCTQLTHFNVGKSFGIHRYRKCLGIDDARVARWFIFIPKILNFGVSGIFSGHLVILWLLGIFPMFWYIVPGKIWQPSTVSD